MKAFLMYRDRDFDMDRKLPPNEQALAQDLELNALFNAMAQGDRFLFEVARRAIFSSLNDLDTILYRQGILKDCLKNSSIIRDIYGIAVESIEKKKEHWWGFSSRYPGSILHSSRAVLQMLVGQLKKLKNIADEHADEFESEGFTTFFALLKQELGGDYFAKVQHHLRELKFRNGVLVSAELGTGNKGTNYVLRKSKEKKQSWLQRMLRIFTKKPPVYSFTIAPRDENGARALSELRDKGINLAANALAQSAEHILSFLDMLQVELGFYIGCINLFRQLSQKGEPVCFPMPMGSGERRHSFIGLYDVCLALTLRRRIVGNDLSAAGKNLVIITGANQGGKSTFLRSIGLAQLMMQCGMFTPAESFSSNICEGLFTHCKREEDVTMKSGKLDEELSRMSDIVDNITANSMVLFNESFAATNEREGSEIARQITCALLDKQIKVFYVTHQYEFAHGFQQRNLDYAIFLRAERQADGRADF